MLPVYHGCSFLGVMRMIDCAVTLLPQPDSPTMPNVRFFLMRERHTVDRFKRAFFKLEIGVQVFHLKQDIRH